MSSRKCLTRVSNKSVKEECFTRMSSKSVSPERCAIVSSKGVLQECHLTNCELRVSQKWVCWKCDKEVLSLFVNIRVGIRVRGLHLVFFFW